MSNKKAKAKPLFIFPIYRGKKLSIEVQTDKIEPASLIDSRKDLTNEPKSFRNYPSFSYNTI